MSKSMRNILVLAKVQVAAGVAEAMTAGSDAVLARAITPNPVNADFQDRELIRPYLGNSGKVQIKNYSTIDFEVEIAGAGTAGDVPGYGQLLRGCGFSENIVASTRVDYTPVSTGFEALTLDVYLDGVLHRMTDAKGTVSFKLDAGGIPVMSFNFTGFYVAAADSANPSGVDYSKFLSPLGVTKQNTPAFTVHGYAAKATEFNVDMASDVAYRNYIGAESVDILDRKPTGGVTLEYDAISSVDWWEKARLGTLGAVNMVHGTVAGNIVELAAPKVQVTTPSLTDDNSVAMIGLGLELQPDTGNDELVLSVR